MTQLFVDRINRALALDVHQVVNLCLNSLFCLIKLRSIGLETRNSNLIAQVVLDGIRQYKVTISQTLHQCRSTQSVCTMVREVSLTNSKQTLYAGLQLVVNPDTTHSIVDSRINHHWVIILNSIDFISHLARINVGDFLIHIKQVAIALTNHVNTQTTNSLREVKEHSQAGIVDTIALVATLFCST